MAIGTPGERETLKEKAFEEMKRYIALTIYLWVTFAVLAYYRRLLLKENGIDVFTQGYAIINALVFAKVLLLGGILHLGASLRRHAFGLVVVGRTLMFTALLMAFHVVEEAVRALIKGEPVADSLLHLGGGSWLGVWVYAALLFVMLLPIAILGEISFVLGKGELWKIMTSKRNQVLTGRPGS